MATYTSSLPDRLLHRLGQMAKELSLPKNKIIEKALEIYLTEMDKAAFAFSFRKAKGDEDLLEIAEEGMTDYFNQLEDWDATR